MPNWLFSTADTKSQIKNETTQPFIYYVAYTQTNAVKFREDTMLKAKLHIIVRADTHPVRSAAE